MAPDIATPMQVQGNKTFLGHHRRPALGKHETVDAESANGSNQSKAAYRHWKAPMQRKRTFGLSSRPAGSGQKRPFDLTVRKSGPG